MSYSKEIAEKLVEYLNEEDYNYDFDVKEGCIKMGFPLRKKLKRVRIVLDIEDDHYVSLGFIDINAGKESQMEVAKYMTMVNYITLLGNFEMDFKDGEIRYKYVVEYDSNSLTGEIIKKSLDIPVSAFYFYGDELLKIIFGFATADEAFKAVTSDDSEDDVEA